MTGQPFHSVLGKATATNKLKAMSAGPGLKVFSSFDSLSYMWDLSNRHAVSGFEDRNQVHTTGSWTQVAAGTWDALELKPGGLRAHSTNATSNAVSSDILVFDKPAGAKSCVLHMLRWSKGGYLEVFAVTNTNITRWLDRIHNNNSASLTWSGNVQGGSKLQTIAGTLLDTDTRIEIHVNKGLLYFLGLRWHAHNGPVDSHSFTHSDCIIGDPSSLSTREIKQDIETLPNAQCIDLVGQMRATTYQRPDLAEQRLGMISGEVQEALDPLGIGNVCVSKFVAVGAEAKDYLALQYKRLVPLLIGSVNALAARVQEVENAAPKKREDTWVR